MHIDILQQSIQMQGHFNPINTIIVFLGNIYISVQIIHAICEHNVCRQKRGNEMSNYQKGWQFDDSLSSC